ncbi:MAG: HlyD family efflux transporter periplasmic adaptor subunit [Planctomycetota bacterium]|jgi:HlyD family secretion protein|nr:HlyD family efflux transporter periplasmic adaptor subunit [Planctomycetota bacterium]
MRWLLAILFLVGILFLGREIYPLYPFFPVDSGPPVYPGYVEADYLYAASSRAGRLTELRVDRGDQVTAGQEIFQLEAEPEASNLARARSRQEAASASHQDLLSGARPPEIEVLLARREQALAQERESSLRLDRGERLHVQGGISTADLDQIRSRHDTDLALIRQVEQEIESAELPARSGLQLAAAAELAAATAEVREAAWNSGEKQVISQVDALVVDIFYLPGEWVAAGRPVVKLLPPQQRRLVFFVPEADVALFQLGETVFFRQDGQPATASARLYLVSPEAEFSPPMIYSNESRHKLTYRLEATPTDSNHHLHPGTPVQVTRGESK